VNDTIEVMIMRMRMVKIHTRAALMFRHDGQRDNEISATR